MLALSAGDYALTLDPERGGAMLRFDWCGRPLAGCAQGPRNRALPSQDARWRGGWTIAARTPRSATLLLHCTLDWTYVASQAFVLDEDGLTMTLALVNLGRRALPADVAFDLALDEVDLVDRDDTARGPILLAPGAVRSTSLRLRATAPLELSYFG